MKTNQEFIMLMNYSEKMYNFLGRIYRKEIDKEFLNQIKNMSFPENSSQEELSEGFVMLKEYLHKLDVDVIDELAADYAKVFLAAGLAEPMAAFPYESVYTSKKGIVMQEAWDLVREIYAEEGLSMGDVDSDILEDHIALELEFMAYLCKEAVNNGSSSLITKQEDFLNEHLLNWAPGLCADIDKYADTLFYKAIGKITIGFLKLNKTILETIKGHSVIKTDNMLSYKISPEKIDNFIQELKEEYNIFAPRISQGRKTKDGRDLINFGQIDSYKEIVTNAQSDFSAKEIYYPISQTMLYFRDDRCIESKEDKEKGVIIFARPCDINSIKRLDNIFIKNGDCADNYYKRLRDKVKFFMIECTQGFEDCFCVSMESNKTDDYSVAFRFDENDLNVQIKDSEFAEYFTDEKKSEFIPEFVQTNAKTVKIPKIGNKEELKIAGNLEFWKEYNDRCIGCGGCNTVCGTCSCFDTVDVIYNETSKDGERRRIWSSCMLDTFTQTAGGNRARKTPGENMRFKTLHKVYDYNLRFGENEQMCVGCGRCDIRCPEDISFIEAINRLSEEMDNELIKRGENNG